MSLDDWRSRIDELDAAIVSLLNERTTLAVNIGKQKALEGKQLYVPSREKQVLQKVAELSNGPLKDKHIHAIYREVMSAALDLEGGITIAYLGPESTHSHMAARQQFGESVRYLACETFEEVFKTVEKGIAAYGMVPIENSREGSVTTVQDCLTLTPLKIYAEHFFAIRHHIASKASSLDAIREVYSHPQVLGQCQQWLSKHLPGVPVLPCASSAAAANLAVKHPQAAGICTEMAAESYGLNLLQKDIQDQANNTTRFFILGQELSPPSGKDKTSIAFGLKHTVGALNHALASLEENKVNLTKIASRPSPWKNWEYLFFVDLRGHISDENVKNAIQTMEEHCTFIRVLGSYPAAQ